MCSSAGDVFSLMTLLFTIAALLASVLSLCDAGEPVSEAREKKIRAVYASIGADKEKGFERLRKPTSNEWLGQEDEEPQSLEDFMICKRPQLSRERFVIVMQPIGKFDEAQRQLIKELTEYAGAFFQLPVRIADDLNLETLDKGLSLSRRVPLDRFSSRTQYDASRILEVVMNNLIPADAALYIGITNGDLYADQQNLFGYASTTERTGLISFARYYKSGKKGPDQATKRRAFKFTNHEIGHMLGLQHCVFYRCSMNGCSSLKEADGSLNFCPVCQQKLKWALEYDEGKRRAQLETFYRAHGVLDENPKARAK